MSTMPPNLVGPILQAHLTARQAARVRDTEQAQEANAHRMHSSAIDAKDSTVETTDGDTRAYADAEGSGSQGRPFGEAQQEQPDDSTPEDRPGEEGQHIDLEA